MPVLSKIKRVERSIREALDDANEKQLRIGRVCDGCALHHIMRQVTRRLSFPSLTDVARLSLDMDCAEAWAFMSGWDTLDDWHENWLRRTYGAGFNERHKPYWDMGHRLAKEYIDANETV